MSLRRFFIATPILVLLCLTTKANAQSSIHLGAIGTITLTSGLEFQVTKVNAYPNKRQIAYFNASTGTSNASNYDDVAKLRTEVGIWTYNKQSRLFDFVPDREFRAGKNNPTVMTLQVGRDVSSSMPIGDGTIVLANGWKREASSIVADPKEGKLLYMFKYRSKGLNPLNFGCNRQPATLQG